MADDWHGKLHSSKRFDDLSLTALYSNDLRVRAAAIEINLAVYNLSKTEETAEQLMASAEKSPAYRPYATWELGMLANRGVARERFMTFCAATCTTPIRKHATGRLRAWRTSVATIPIKDFLDVFRNDPALEVRERAGCSLAKSGMLTREQRDARGARLDRSGL